MPPTGSMMNPGAAGDDAPRIYDGGDVQIEVRQVIVMIPEATIMNMDCVMMTPKTL